ncbi:carcinoembryonic antigen-related cell adhesion molecule 7-like isoform X2 [Dendropsophus ebraccatus]|uniref:carcinoembryonic antigen-related cell adhesion molecule 7-like isoform X2 n=1 Tax=Dendropsophus ebraccatus TaxID=150705 RepID=UPI0038313975
MRADIIAVLILHMDLISGKIHIQLCPQHPTASESVVLSVIGITENIEYFTWFKGPDTSAEYQIGTHMSGVSFIQGKLYSSRFSTFSNGSLLIQDLQVGDGGYYRVKVQTGKQEDAEVFLHVYEPVGKPVITASHAEIKEDDFVSLTCVSSNADRISWIKLSSETMTVEIGNIVKHDNGTIVFPKIKRSDEGKYECRAENPVSQSSSDVYTLNISRLNESLPYNSAGVTAGIICGAILGLLLIVTVSLLLYKRYGPRRKKLMTGPPIGVAESYAIYNNILDPATGLELKDEPLYMCLEFSSEGAYSELHK